MKNILLLVSLLLVGNLFAGNSFTEYHEHIAKDRLIVIFEKNVSPERKAEIIQSSGLVSSFAHLPSPALSICMTTDLEAAKRFFSTVQEVKFVSFFITDGNNHYAGVLNDFFVKLKDKNMEPMLKEKLKALNLDEPAADKYIPNLYKIRNLKSVSSRLTRGEIRNTIDVCAEFLKEGWVEYAAPNYLLNPDVNSNDPLYSREWNISNTGSAVQGHGIADADMDVDSAWTLSTGDPNIKVGVIDSGVDTLQPDLVQNILPGHDAISDSTDGYPTPAYPEDGHGTCCSGIIAAVKDNGIGCAGVAPSCKILPVRAFYYMVLSAGSDPIPYSTGAAFADAIGWAWSDGGADILSNSWSLPSFLIALLPGGTQPVEDAIVTAHTNGRGGKGIAMFFSSGNSGTSTGPLWPGPMPETITVNATNMCDSAVSSGDCSGANWAGDYGDGLDFSAPGTKITTTDMRGAYGFSNNDNELTFGGTSASCPNAAGVGALILSMRPELHAEDVRNLIAQTCDKVTYNYSTTLANGTWCPRLGYGRVNAFRALQQSFFYSGINETKEEVALNIFPNPTTGVLNIGYKGAKNTIASLCNITGEELLQKELTEGINSVDVSSLPSGLYLVRTDTGGGIVTRKVTIIRQ